ncbi:MAG: hypothetical protein ACO1SV_01015 [Fimbriimonas sp.]
MNLNAKMLLNLARFATFVVALNVLAGCVGGSEGELSDEEKLKKMSQGRPNYGQGMSKPTGGDSTSGTTTGQ